MKLFVPKHKKPITRNLHQQHGKFHSVNDMKECILDDLKEEFPEDANIDVGYYDGRQSAKIWLVSTEDLNHMYSICKNGEVSLWVEHTEDGNSDEEEESVPAPKKSRKVTNKRQAIDDEVEEIFKELSLKHRDSNNYSAPQLRLWAKMIQSGNYDDYDDPPRVPQITGIVSNRKESLTEAITGAAVAVAKVFAPVPKTLEHVPSASNNGTSPRKSTELRFKNLEQLHLLQQLKVDGVLSQEEFMEQKKIILDAIKNLSS